MSQDAAIILAFRIAVLADVAAIFAFIMIYSALAPWHRNPIGRTIVIKDILLILLLAPSVLSLFFHFNRLTSHVAAWIDVGLFVLMAVVMVWRCVVWIRIHREKIAAIQNAEVPRPGKGHYDNEVRVYDDEEGSAS